MYDIIIVGAGTAGLTAAIYGVRAGKSVLVLEAKTYGGQIINTPKIENYPGIKEISGFEYAKNLYEQAKDLGAEIRFEQVTAIETAESGKLVKTTKDSYECRSVILATGAKNSPPFPAAGCRNSSERECLTALPATACFSGEEMWQWLAAATPRWKMLHFSLITAAKCISSTGDQNSVGKRSWCSP